MDSKAGAVAFVKHYVELINYAQATGDVGALAAVEAEKCEACDRGRTYIKAVYSAGGRIVGGQFNVADISALPRSSDGDWLVVVGIHINAETVTRPDRTPSSERHEKMTLITDHVVEYLGGSWQVVQRTRAS